MQTVPHKTYWLTAISPGAIWFICRNNWKKPATVYYRQGSGFYLGVFHLMIRWLSLPIDVQLSTVAIGTLSTADGRSVSWEVATQTVRVARQAANALLDHPLVERLKSSVPERLTFTFLERLSYHALLPIVRLVKLAQWHRRMQDDQSLHVILVPGIEWLGRILPVLAGEQTVIEQFARPLNRAFIQHRLKRALMRTTFEDNLPRTAGKTIMPDRIGVHCLFGLDSNKQSDLYWFAPDITDPRRIIVYMDSDCREKPAVVKTAAEKNGMHWVRIIRRFAIPGPAGIAALVMLTLKTSLALLGIRPRDEWLRQQIVKLLDEAAFWEKFFRRYHVRIHHEIDLFVYDLPKCIAIDRLGGLQLSKQRSDFKMNGWMPVIRNTAHHVFFTWNRRIGDYRDAFSGIRQFIVSGFPHDRFVRQTTDELKQIEHSWHQRGVRFTVALFDNGFDNDILFSAQMMETFYTRFLDWVAANPEIGMIIKSKKADLIQGLPKAARQLTNPDLQARVKVLGAYKGALCGPLANVADFAIGIGIGSAVIETVLVGCRGIHCDLPSHQEHVYYQWGPNQLVFNDIDKLMVALQDYLQNPEKHRDLGSWDDYLDLLDPFRDGRAGHRIGTYTQSLLAGYDAQLPRADVILQANESYAQAYGTANVVSARISDVH